jgi:hypothetical protein
MHAVPNIRPGVGWIVFGGLVAVNLVWLVVDVRSNRDASEVVAQAYGECRAALRRVNAEAIRARFPTGDLIRVTRGKGSRYHVRGYFSPANRTSPEWYSCVVYDRPSGLTVDSVELDGAQKR